MTSLAKDRFPVLPPAARLPPLEDIGARFTKFLARMRRGLYGDSGKGKLRFGEDSKIKNLAQRAYKRRLRASGLPSVKPEALPAVMALACEGGRLGGPVTEDDVYRLIAELHGESQWMRDVSTWVMKQMLRNVAAGTRGLALPPMILAGPPGVGKSHYARRLAELSGLPVRMIDVGGGSAGFRISGTEKGWSTEQPGIPVETILARRVANPIMMVD